MSVREQVIDLIDTAQAGSNVMGVPKALVDFLGGDHRAAILLNQMLYWADRTSDPDGWFYKSFPEWEAETGLSEYQVRRRVTNLLKPIGIETKVRKGRLPSPTTHYRVVAEKLTAAIDAWLRSLRNLGVEGEETSGSTLKFVEGGSPTNLGVEGEEASGTLLSKTTSKTLSPDHSKEPAPVVLTEEADVERARQAWEIAHGQMAIQFDRANFDTWVRETHFIHKNGVFEIGVPTEFARNVLQYRLYRDVRRILSDVWGERVEIKFQVQPRPVPPEEDIPLYKLLARQAAACAPSPRRARGDSGGAGIGNKRREG